MENWGLVSLVYDTLSAELVADIFRSPTVLQPYYSTKRHRISDSRIELHTLSLTSLLISGLVTLLRWTGGVSYGSMKALLPGLDG
jgi:hypothetical protein